MAKGLHELVGAAAGGADGAYCCGAGANCCGAGAYCCGGGANCCGCGAYCCGCGAYCGCGANCCCGCGWYCCCGGGGWFFFTYRSGVRAHAVYIKKKCATTMRSRMAIPGYLLASHVMVNPPALIASARFVSPNPLTQFV